MGRLIGFGLLGLFFLVVVSVFVNRPTDPSGGGTGAVATIEPTAGGTTYTATETDEPVAEEPIAEEPVSDEPVEPETASNPALDRWLEFSLHITSEAPDAAEIMGSISELDPTDFAAYLLKAYELRQWTAGELAWLKANPPAACFKSTYTHYKRSIDQYDLAARLMIKGIPDFDVDRINRANAAMTKGGSSIQSATSSLPGSQDRCTA